MRACLLAVSLSLLPLVVGRCVWPGARSWRCADGSRPPAVHQTEPKACKEWTPHCLYRRPLLLHDRHAAEEPAQVHWSHRGREIIPIHTLWTGKWTLILGQSGPIAPSACGLILQPVIFSASDVLQVTPAEESRCQICQSGPRCKLPDELPQVTSAFNSLRMDINRDIIQMAAVKHLQLLHRHMIDLSHIDVSLIDGWGSRMEPGSLCRVTRPWQNISSAPPSSPQRSFALLTTMNSNSWAATFWLLNWHRIKEQALKLTLMYILINVLSVLQIT